MKFNFNKIKSFKIEFYDVFYATMSVREDDKI